MTATTSMSTSEFIQGKMLSGRVYPEFFPFDQNDRVLNIGCGYGPQAFVYQGMFDTMVGIDINHDRLQQAMTLRDAGWVDNFHVAQSNVERLPFATSQFSKALAIDIIEHVEHPEAMCREIHRVMVNRGQVLLTFPALHDHYTALFSWVARNILRRQSKGTFHDQPETWHPDAHNQSYPLKTWLKLVEDCGFKLIQSRASTLFPPLHLYGVPRFWFKNNQLHQIDAFFARQPVLKYYGQALMGIFEVVK